MWLIEKKEKGIEPAIITLFITLRELPETKGIS